MADIPGKSCGSCTMCCKVLEIEEFKKPPGPYCGFCIAGGGCSNYLDRPPVCREFECLWKSDRGLSAMYRPDKVGTILMEDPDNDDYLAVCDPARPLAWRTPMVFSHLVTMAKSGRMVLAKAGLKAWRVHASGAWGPYA
jgi:uncharacterized protein